MRAGKENKKIIANTAWMVFDKVFMLALNLLVTVKIANHYGSLGYGDYQYAVSVVALFEILVTFVDARVVKKIYISKDSNQVVFVATCSRLMFSILSAILGIAFIFIYNGGYDFSVMFAILLLNAIIGNLKFGMANRFEYLLKSKKVVIAADIAAIIGSLLQLRAVRMNWSIISISIIALINTAINVIIITIQYRLEFKKREKIVFDKSMLKEMIVESLPLAIAASCATIYTRCDSVMLGSMMSKSEVGIYAISVKLISIVQIAIVPIRESVYPKMIALYDSDRKAYERQYVKITSLMTWIYIVGVIASFVVLPSCFKVLNEEYAMAYPVYQIHVLGTFFMYNAALRAGHFTLINRGSILMYSQIISVVANIVLNYVGIKIWGMYGAALATVFTQATSLMFSNLFFKKDGQEVFWWQIMALNPIRIIR